MSAPGTIRTRDLAGRNGSLYPLSYGGNPDTLAAYALADLPARMAAKVRVDGDCWTWTGALTSRGYSCLGIDGKRVLGHRRAYELLVGPIPAGLTIDHLCRNKPCINPAHLEPVTQAVNNARKPPRERCAKGHRMEGENLRIKLRANGRTQRECRACQIEWTRASYQRLTDRKPRSDRVDTDAFLAAS